MFFVKILFKKIYFAKTAYFNLQMIRMSYTSIWHIYETIRADFFMLDYLAAYFQDLCRRDIVTWIFEQLGIS